MPGITKEVRTIMYSVEPTGHVALHKFPFNANDKYGMEKLQRLVKRGFTFADPRKPGSPNTPQVIVTGVVDLTKPASVEQVDEDEKEVAEIPNLGEMVIAELSDEEAIEKRLADKMLDVAKAEVAEGLAKAEDLPKRKYTKHNRRVKE